MKDRKILVPLDGSPISAQTLKTLIDLKENIPSPVTLLHVLDLDTLSYRGFAETSFGEIEERAREEARQFIAGMQQSFADAGVQVEAIVKEGHIRETICKIADVHRARHIHKPENFLYNFDLRIDNRVDMWCMFPESLMIFIIVGIPDATQLFCCWRN